MDISIKKSSLVSSVFVSILLSSASWGTTAFFDGVTVLKLKTYARDFGLCTITTSVNLNTDGSQNLACGNTVNLSFGCEGITNPETGEVILTKTAGNINWQAVQLAYVTGKKINVYVWDDVQLNDSVCYADRVIVRD